VVNASPVILFARIGRIALVEDLAAEIIITSGVAREIQEGPSDDPGRLWLAGAGTSRVQAPEPVSPLITAWDLGAGESQVLSWAHQHPSSEVILDDRAARNCAVSLGIPVRGTLGVILLAKKEGKVSSAAPIFEELRNAGLRISPAVLEAALRLAGE
jgi:predicted nucleic acid-binding protein